MERRKSVIAYKTIERKYFKPPKEPNMLTWSEKEQIRNLHQNEPEKWTPITIAESFPVSPDIVKKLIRAKWKPSSPERIIQHDRTVSDNWVAFHQGKLKIHNSRLRIHLEKFTDRKYGVRAASLEEAKKITEIVMPRPQKTEFLSLITSFRTEEDCKIIEKDTKRLEDNPRDVKFISESKNLTIMDRSKADYTLNQLRTRIKDVIETMPDPPHELKAMVGQEKQSALTGNCSNIGYVAPSERFNPNAVMYQRRGKSDIQLQDPNDSPDRIEIPKEMQKIGKVHRVNDSFYSDKGQFLYRVPGLKP